MTSKSWDRPGARAASVGRIAAEGLADEHQDRRYLMVDGIDGRAHYLTASTDGIELPMGAIVAVTANNQPRSADLTIAKLASRGLYLTKDVTAVPESPASQQALKRTCRISAPTRN